MATKFERIYSQISAELIDIKSDFKYANDSAAFGHLMVKMILGISDEEANESITDGFNDNGIDAIYIDTRGIKPHIHFFQFKFPQDETKINSGVSQDEVLKLINGFECFIGNDEKFNSLSWNDLLLQKREEFVDIDDTDNITLNLIRFTTMETSDNLNMFNSKIAEMCNLSGNNIIAEAYFARRLTDIYEKNRLNSWPDFEIVYKKSLSPFTDDYAKILTFYVPLYSIYNSLNLLETNVFDGNVRFYDEKSKVNQGIIQTLEKDCSRFHLLNNGITIVCSDVHDKNSTDTVVIKKGSIINGAQTVGCIMKVIKEAISNGQDIERFKKAFVSLKVIKIDEKKELLDELVFTLNTQNQMKSSYVISNDPNVKAIQKKINLTTKYFLQIKNNEYSYEKNTTPSFNKLKKDIIDIETAIQSVVAYENIGELGYLTKNNKASLFNEENINVIVDELSYDNLLQSYELYLDVMELTKNYRAYRKDSSKRDILDTLSLNKDSDINYYRFINTGNYPILFALGVYCRKFKVNPKDNIITVIKLIMPLFRNKTNVSNLTKTKETFDKIKDLINKH